MENKRVTIYDLAERLHIATSTVSRALSGNPQVSEEMRELVCRTAAEMGYRSNKVASALSRRAVRIAILLENQSPDYISELKAGMMAAFSELKDYNVSGDFYKANSTIGEYGTCLADIIAKNYDGIIVMSVINEWEIVPIINRNADKKTVYATVVSDVEGTIRKLAVLNNGFVAGGMAAEFLGFTVPEGKSVVIITGQQRTKVHANTIRGFQKEVSSRGLTLAGIYEHYDDLELAYRLADEVLQKHPDLGGIYFNSACSPTFCQRLKELKREKDIMIVASDVYPKIAELIDEGTINATIYQDPYQQGWTVVKNLYEYIAEGKRFDQEEILLNPQFVMKSNLCLYKDILQRILNNTGRS